MPETPDPICPYCGSNQPPTDARCQTCRGPLDPLSRQRTQNDMGPWFVRDEARPFRPGCSHASLVMLARRGHVVPDSVIRGPTTRQFWRLARHTQGVAHLFGLCYSCDATVDPASRNCPACSAPLHAEGDRDHLGLAPIRPLPGDPPTPPMKTPATRAAPRAVAPQAPAPAPPAEEPLEPPARRTNPALLAIVLILGVATGGAAVYALNNPADPPEAVPTEQQLVTTSGATQERTPENITPQPTQERPPQDQPATNPTPDSPLPIPPASTPPASTTTEPAPTQAAACSDPPPPTPDSRLPTSPSLPSLADIQDPETLEQEAQKIADAELLEALEHRAQQLRLKKLLRRSPGQ